jgi:hypothetical protein
MRRGIILIRRVNSPGLDMVWECNSTTAPSAIAAPNTKENGTWTRWTAKESAPTKTKATTWEASDTTNDKARAITSGAMDAAMRALGRTTEWKGKAFLFILIKMNLLASSKTTTSTKKASS